MNQSEQDKIITPWGITLTHKEKRQIAEAKKHICNYLAACQPSTYADIIRDVAYQIVSVEPMELMPIFNLAMVELNHEGKIEKYEQMPFYDPMDYAWELTDEEQKVQFQINDIVYRKGKPDRQGKVCETCILTGKIRVKWDTCRTWNEPNMLVKVEESINQ